MASPRYRVERTDGKAGPGELWDTAGRRNGGEVPSLFVVAGNSANSEQLTRSAGRPWAPPIEG